MTHQRANHPIVTVTPNPALDVTYTVAGINLGESHRVPTPLYRAGGKGINVSRVINQLGHTTTAIATAGGVAGEQLQRDLDGSDLPHRVIPVAAATRRTVALVDTVNNQTSIFNEVGPALTAAEWQALAAAVVDALENGASVLVGSGSLPANAPEDFYASLVAMGHSFGVPVIIDTSGAGILAAARARADLLKPNNDELREALGEADLPTAARKLLELGAQRVLVSAGTAGMLAFDSATPGHYLSARLPQPLSGNPTGAGDAAVAAAAMVIAAGDDSLEQLLRSATSVSAAAVLMPGAGEVSLRYAELADQLIITRHTTSQDSTFGTTRGPS